MPKHETLTREQTIDYLEEHPAVLQGLLDAERRAKHTSVGGHVWGKRCYHPIECPQCRGKAGLNW